jgi:hypothetical protein
LFQLSFLSCWAHCFALYNVPPSWRTHTVIVPPAEEASAYAPPPAISSEATPSSASDLEKPPMGTPFDLELRAPADAL